MLNGIFQLKGSLALKCLRTPALCNRCMHQDKKKSGRFFTFFLCLICLYFDRKYCQAIITVGGGRSSQNSLRNSKVKRLLKVLRSNISKQHSSGKICRAIAKILNLTVGSIGFIICRWKFTCGATTDYFWQVHHARFQNVILD